MHVTLVAGLPASGKSSWARAQLQEQRRAGLRVDLIDDPSSAELLQQELARVTKAGCEQLYVVDPNFCDPAVLTSARLTFIQRGDEVHVVFFENNPKQCLRNAGSLDRAGKVVEGAIRQWAMRYAPRAGDDAVVLPVYQAVAA